MIIIRMLGEDYEQDIRPLIKAFYPEDEFYIEHADFAGTVKKEEDTSDAGKQSLSFLEDGRACLKKNGSEIIEPLTATFQLLLKLDSYQVELALADGRKYEATEDFSVVIPGTYRNEGLPDRRMYRNALHRHIYELLHKATQIDLPWGTLTGIRPTKLVLERMAAGDTREAIADYFKAEYLCSEKKTNTCIRVAEHEKELLKGIDEDTYSLYIGIPFCPSICLYCSFSSFPLEQYKDYVEPYLEALYKEIDFAKGCFPEKKLVSIYFGGGTPTTLSAEQLRGLIRKVKESFDLRYLREWTIEAGRPDSITREKLVVMKEEGITRISINPQTMQQKTLDLIGRKHTVEQIIDAFGMARQCGHDNINMDLIIGLTGEKKEDVDATLKSLSELEPDSITVHTLAVKRAARLNTERELYKDKRSTEAAAMSLACETYMEQHGYEPYYMYRQKNMADNLENIGYAKVGKEGLYNILIMEEYHTILALGANASTKFVFPGTGRLERVENVKSVRDYVMRIDEMIGRKQAFLEQYRRQL